jgi:hypothetical protein
LLQGHVIPFIENCLVGFVHGVPGVKILDTLLGVNIGVLKTSDLLAIVIHWWLYAVEEFCPLPR